jgi:hypothetical protein
MPVSIAGPEPGVRRRHMTVRSLSLPVIDTPGLAAGVRVWLLAALLLLPVYFLYLVHLTVMAAPGTGFLQYDQAYYMAIARAYFADGGFAPLYGLPFSADPATPRIYFQPLTLALGIAGKISGSDPGILYMTAGLLLALCCARVMIALYREVVPASGWAAALGLLCFFWGGGCLCIVSVGYVLATGGSPLADMFHFDPNEGFWFLNLGRTLIFTTEAFYHLVFLGCVVLVVRRQFAAALLGAAILSASHPFTGLQLLAVLGVWSIIDRFVVTSDRPPLYFTVGLAALGILHIAYYLVFLDHASAEHRILHQQWALASRLAGANWILPWSTMLAAYGPVAALAAGALIGQWRRRKALTRLQRLLLVWFAVSFALANHDLVMAPLQPLHFTRGYIWAPLFLLGAPLLLRLIAQTARGAAPTMVPALIVGFLLLDNAAWFGRAALWEHYSNEPNGITLDAQERAALESMGDQRFRGYLLVSQSPKLGYLATVYSPLRSWYSHVFNTPHAKLRKAEVEDFFASGSELEAWRDRPLLAVLLGQEAVIAERLETAGFSAVMSNDAFLVLARPSGRP